MLYLHGFGTMFYVLCDYCSDFIFCSMANIDDHGFLGDSFNHQSSEEEMDVEQPAAAHIVDVQTSKSEHRDHGKDIRDNLSLLDSSSDPPAGQGVLSEGPGREYMARSVPQPPGQVPSGANIPASISNMHINVGSIATAGVHTTP